MLILEPLIFLTLTRTGEHKGIGLEGPTSLVLLPHAGDDVGAAKPVGLGKVGFGPLCRMVGMGVIKADDVQLPLACLALDVDQLLRAIW